MLFHIYAFLMIVVAVKAVNVQAANIIFNGPYDQLNFVINDELIMNISSRMNGCTVRVWSSDRSLWLS